MAEKYHQSGVSNMEKDNNGSQSHNGSLNFLIPYPVSHPATEPTRPSREQDMQTQQQSLLFAISLYNITWFRYERTRHGIGEMGKHRRKKISLRYSIGLSSVAGAMLPFILDNALKLGKVIEEDELGALYIEADKVGEPPATERDELPTGREHEVPTRPGTPWPGVSEETSPPLSKESKKAMKNWLFPSEFTRDIFKNNELQANKAFADLTDPEAYSEELLSPKTVTPALDLDIDRDNLRKLKRTIADPADDLAAKRQRTSNSSAATGSSMSFTASLYASTEEQIEYHDPSCLLCAGGACIVGTATAHEIAHEVETCN